MRVEELEAVCHAASFESSLRRAMAQTSPVCSVSASTDSNDSSQSFIPADHGTDAATSSFQPSRFEPPLTDPQNSFQTQFSGRTHGQDSGSLDGEEDYLRRGTDSVSQSSSETEVSGLKQQQREWETEREELLREMGNLRSALPWPASGVDLLYLLTDCATCKTHQHTPLSWLQQKAVHVDYCQHSLRPVCFLQQPPIPVPSDRYSMAHSVDMWPTCLLACAGSR